MHKLALLTKQDAHKPKNKMHGMSDIVQKACSA